MQIEKGRINWRRRSLVVFILMTFLILISQQTILSICHFCLFEHFLHIPCPACGITRSFISLVNLDIVQSFKMCPFGIAIFLIFFIYTTYLLIATLTMFIDNMAWSKEVRFVNSLDTIIMFLLLSNWVYQLTFN